MRARLTTAVAVAVLAASTGGAVALVGPGNLFTGQSAAKAQYGQNGENGQNGQNGMNCQNGENGRNGQNGQSTVVTITIPAATPLPGSATPTKAHHKLVRVCKRFPHRSARFHRVFHPRTCWYRFL